MTFTAASLADGQLASSLGTIYAVPAATKAYIKNIWLYNGHASAAQVITVNIQRSGGGSRIVRKLQLGVEESASLIEGENALVLSAGDILAAFSTNASSVNYFISGVLEA